MPKKEGPDQARSWAIAMAGCVINGLLSGITRTNGLFYVALIETYGVSRMEANLPFTLRNVVRNLASPLVGAIGQRYGARVVTVIGGILASLGITLCCLAPTVTWICILWGGVHGFGVALGNTLLPVIVNQYFLKHRATASGLSMSGACLGSFFLPVTIELMLHSFGLPGAFLISGGLMMQVLPASIMMVEPSWISKTLDRKGEDVHNNEQAKSEKRIAGNMLELKVEQIVFFKNDDSSLMVDNNRFQPTATDARVFSRTGIDNLAFEGSKIDIRENKIDCTKELTNESKEMRKRTVSIEKTSVAFSEPITYQEMQETSISNSLLKMFRSPMFYVISISLGGLSMLFDPSVTVIVDYIHDKGLQENDAKYFIILMSLGDLLGRLCLSWITDRGYMSFSRFMFFMQVIQGICFMVMPLFHQIDVLMTIITIYGLASGATLVMYPFLVSKYLPSMQSLAIGFISILTGFISFAIPPMIGYFRDHVGSYDGMFVITGSLSVGAGCVWLSEPLLSK